MKVQIIIDEKDLRALILDHLQSQLGESAGLITPSDVNIEVKSKQNYKSEWEKAAIRAIIDRTI